MKKIEQEASTILNYVGGTSNVTSLVHCATRLRFVLKDNNKIEKDKLEKLPSVLSVVLSGGQCQVVIGPNVTDFYDVIQQELKAQEPSNENEENKKEKFSLTKVISGAFLPLISIMAGAGMVKALLTVLATLHWLSPTSTLYLVCSAAGNSVFYFLPIFLGVTLSKQFKADPFVGGALGAALLEPNFTGLIGKHGLKLLGLGLEPIDYSMTVFPIFVIIAVYVLLDKLLKKIIPRQLQLFLNPMICLLLLVPATVLVFGPFGTNVGNWISAAIMWLFGKSRLIAGLVLGAAYPFLTVLGLHWGFTPITLQNLKSVGGDVVEGVNVCAVWGQIGIALGTFLYTLHKKDSTKLREVSGSTAVTGIFAGVTEPILYGLIMQSKRLMIITAIAGGIGGAVSGLCHVMMTSYVFHNIFSIFMLSYKPIGSMIMSSGISLILGIILTYFWGFKKDEVNSAKVAADLVQAATKDQKPKASSPLIITSPFAGKVIDLASVQDKVFASKSVGKGLAFIPSSNHVVAPFNGQVITVLPSQHAIGLRGENGVEVLIHIGLDTVKLNGKYFKMLVKNGERVKQGQELLTADLKQIKNAGYVLESPVIITNPEQYQIEFNVKAGDLVQEQDQIMTVQ